MNETEKRPPDSNGPTAQGAGAESGIGNGNGAESDTGDDVASATPILSPVDRLKAQALEAQIIEVLRTVFDPEIPVNIYELGLIYNVDVDAAGNVNVRMTLTSPMCPVAGSLPPEVEQKVKAVDGVTDAKVELVWEPPWTPEKMTEAARLQLNL